MSEQYENKIEELERVENAQIGARGVTKEAKYLCYPIGDVSSQLRSLANKCGLEHDMEDYLDDVTQVQHKLESAFYRCEEAFSDRVSTLRYELQDIEEKENELE